MWPFKSSCKTISKKELEYEENSKRLKEIEEKYPLGSGYNYHGCPVVIVKQNDYYPLYYFDGRCPGVWIEWFDINKVLQSKWVSGEKLKFLKVQSI